jgi:YrbI family 3-deoxy-D-manno-octulosonate 8-phosphate phosphatase
VGLALDFDGVFTDNRVLVTDDGHEAMLCHRSDGIGLARLTTLGLPMIVLSTEPNPGVALRCAKLGLPCWHGLVDKAAALTQWIEEQSLDARRVVYVGNDINDLGCLELVGGPVAVADALEEVKAAARLVLSSPGGHGAVRELCDLVLNRLNRSQASADGGGAA